MLTTPKFRISAPEAEAIERATAERDERIVRLKHLRAQTIKLVVTAREVDMELSAQFGVVRDKIDERLAHALLRRELESEA